MDQTIVALMARGLDSESANKIKNSGYTLRKLKSVSDEKLKSLGLSVDFIQKIRSESRPPVPVDTANEVLFSCRYCCCICRDPLKPVILHHIEPWEKSRNHNKENLAVLCLLHHAQAHTVSELSVNLTAQRIKDAMNRWVKEAKSLDSGLAYGLMKKQTVCWDYYNPGRIFELSEQLGINFTLFKEFETLFEKGIVDNRGIFTPQSRWSVDTTYSSHWLYFMEGPVINAYMANITAEIAKHIMPKILNGIWSEREIKQFLKPGDAVILQGAFYFKKCSNKDNGTGQIRKAYRRAYGIRFEFEFDAYYATSITSKYFHLSRRREESVFAVVREVSAKNKSVLIRATCLAMGCGFDRIMDGRSMLDLQPAEEDFDDF